MTLNLRHDAFCNDVNLIGRVVGIKMNDGMFYEGSVVAINLGYPSATGGLVITSITVSLTPGRIADVGKNPVSLLMGNVADMQLVQNTAMLTDTDIRRLRGAAFESRDLEPIDPSWLPAGDSMSDIDALEGPNANRKDWDQFRANEELFGVSSSSFDENLYTTRLNMSTFTLKQEQTAARLAQEISLEKSDNVHVAIERGQDVCVLWLSYIISNPAPVAALFSCGAGGYDRGNNPRCCAWDWSH